MYPQLDYARLDYERQHQESIRRFVQREEQLCDLRPVRFGLRARAQPGCQQLPDRLRQANPPQGVPGFLV